MIRLLTLASVLIISAGQDLDINNLQSYYNHVPNTDEKDTNAGYQRPGPFVQGLPSNYFDKARIITKPCANRRSQIENVPSEDQLIQSVYLPRQYLPKPVEIEIIKNTDNKNARYNSLMNEGVTEDNHKKSTMNPTDCLTNVHHNDDAINRSEKQLTKLQSAEVSNKCTSELKFRQPTNKIKESTEKQVSEKYVNNDDKLTPDDALGPSRRFMIGNKYSDTPDVIYVNTKQNKDTMVFTDNLPSGESNYQYNNYRNKILENVNKEEINTNNNKDVQNDQYANANKLLNQNVIKQDIDTNKNNVLGKELENSEIDEPLSKHKNNLANIEEQLIDPAKGVGILNSSVSRLSIMDSSRVCYACSSTNDVSCWSPNRRTMVKYCRKGHDACVTKTYQSEGSKVIVIRDCSDTCEVSLPILEKAYKSCSICNTNMCNKEYVHSSACHDSYNIMFILFVTVFIGYNF